MKQIVLITGANGNLAKSVKHLLSDSYTIRSLTTNKKYTNKESIFYWNIKKEYIDENALEG